MLGLFFFLFFLSFLSFPLLGDRIIFPPPPKMLIILTPETHEYVTCHDKRDFTDVINEGPWDGWGDARGLAKWA